VDALPKQLFAFGRTGELLSLDRLFHRRRFNLGKIGKKFRDKNSGTEV
jgi:hypothetical protein